MEGDPASYAGSAAPARVVLALGLDPGAGIVVPVVFRRAPHTERGLHVVPPSLVVRSLAVTVHSQPPSTTVVPGTERSMAASRLA